MTLIGSMNRLGNQNSGARPRAPDIAPSAWPETSSHLTSSLRPSCLVWVGNPFLPSSEGLVHCIPEEGNGQNKKGI